MRKSYLQTSGRAKVEHFVWEIPIYQLNLLLGGAFHVENFYLQTQLQRFVWEIPIYKLNWSVSCGKFLFTNSTGAFRVGNFYLQTQLVCFPYLQTILQTYLQTSFLREKSYFPGERSMVRNPPESNSEGFLTMDRSPGK